MKKRKLLTLVGSICLVLVLVALLLPACAKEAPAPVAPAPVAPAPVTPAPVAPVPVAPVPEYPTKPITFVVGFSAGGGSDTWTRVVAMEMEKQLMEAIVVINVPGASGLVQLERVMRHLKADGYKVSLYSSSAIGSTARGMEGPDLRNPAEATLIGGMRFFGYFLAGRVDSGVETLQDLVALSKTETVKVGCPGAGSTTCMFNFVFRDLVRKQDGGDIELVMFGSDAPGIKELLAGGIRFYGTNYGQFLPYLSEEVELGLRLRVLAQTGLQRAPAVPDVPTFIELGYDVIIGHTHGLAVSPDTPKYIVDILTKAFSDATHTPEYSKAQDKVGRFAEVYRSPEESVDDMNTRHDLVTKLMAEGVFD